MTTINPGAVHHIVLSWEDIFLCCMRLRWFCGTTDSSVVQLYQFANAQAKAARYLAYILYLVMKEDI